MIIGLTHDAEGRVKIRRTVVTKVCIGEVTTEGKLKRFEHFLFKKHVRNGRKMEWVLDEDLMEAYAGPRLADGAAPTCACCPLPEQRENPCKKMDIVLLDDDTEKLFRNELAAYSARGRWCYGNGTTAYRREGAPEGEKWGEFKILPEGSCANDGLCPYYADRVCMPNGDLYFMLARFPQLGSVCRLHTQSFASISELNSSLNEVKSVLGRLQGVTLNLFVHPAINRYTDDEGRLRNGVKHILGVNIPGNDLQHMQEKVLEAAKVFNNIRRELNGVVEYEDPDSSDRAEEIAEEFYPAKEVRDASQDEDDVVIIPPGSLPRNGGVRRASEAPSAAVGAVTPTVERAQAVQAQAAAPPPPKKLTLQARNEGSYWVLTGDWQPMRRILVMFAATYDDKQLSWRLPTCNFQQLAMNCKEIGVELEVVQ